MSARSRFGGTIPPRQFPVQQQAPQQYAPAPPQLPPQAMGDPGYGGGASPVDLRRALAPIESRLGELYQRLAQVEGSANAAAVLGKMLQGRAHPGFSQDDIISGLSGEAVSAAIMTGKCLPYMVGVDVFVPKGVSGTVLPAGEIFISSDGPLVITDLLAYAQIDPDDADAANYPFSLIKAPSCVTSELACPDVFIAPNADSTFTASPKSLIPSLNAQGRFIPVSPENCRIISPSVETVCYSLDCADGNAPKSYAAQVPIVLLDHPECVDGLVDLQTNGCAWQSQSFPIAFFEDAAFNLTQSSPEFLSKRGACGFLDCNKRLDVRFQPTRPHRFDINLTFVFAGFRIVTCGAGACGIGV